MVIIHDKRLPAEYRQALLDGVKGVTLFPFGGMHASGAGTEVYESVSCHPDIYFFQLDERTVIHAPGLPEELLRSLKEAGVELIRGEGDPHGPYPHTARYNAARVGNFIFHNLSYTDPFILDAARERGLRSVNVAQGYARCSVLSVNDRTIITADKGIAAAAGAENMDVLLLSPGSVLLPGEKYGFIGGAGGRAPDGTVILLGDPGLHPEASEIKGFLDEHAAGRVFLEGMPVYDAGGLMIFD